MSEGVYKPKSGFLVGVAIIGLAIVYFFFLGTSDFKEPGQAIQYDLKEFEDLDKVDTKFTEQAPIALTLEDPRALAVGKDKLYVSGQNAVAVYGPDDTESTRFAVAGDPSCMAVSPDGSLYLGLRDKVLVLDASGKQTAEWGGFNSRSFLTAIALNGQDVYVADAGNRVVSRFSPDGKLQTKIGQKDTDKDVPGLEVPSPYLDLAINNEGHIWVVNPGLLGLERYESDGSIVTSWYRPTVMKLEGFPGCCNPTQIAFTSKGELITCEKGLVRVKMFEVTSGEFDGLVAGSSLFPREHSVRDLAVDPRDRILVLDAQRNAVRVFTRKENDHGQTSQPA